jgi:hypothetical protein
MCSKKSMAKILFLLQPFTFFQTVICDISSDINTFGISLYSNLQILQAISWSLLSKHHGTEILGFRTLSIVRIFLKYQ